MSAASIDTISIAEPAAPAPTRGVHKLALPDGRSALLAVPDAVERAPDRARSLVVMLHGAGGEPRGALQLLGDAPAAHEALVVAPKSVGPTWDVIAGLPRVDADAIARYVTWVRAQYAVDPAHIVIAGFSDGASYALTVGLERGDLFSHVVAFSPGFAAPATRRGQPRAFVAHGTRDQVLSIDACSRRVVPRLRVQGYDVVYREFDGPHTVPAHVVAAAVSWLQSS